MISENGSEVPDGVYMLYDPLRAFWIITKIRWERKLAALRSILRRNP